MLWLIGLVATTWAGGVDFAAEAKRRMKLKVDLDEVERRIDAARPAASPLNGYADQLNSLGYVGDYPQQSYVPQTLPLEPNSDVAGVTVFRDRALVTRNRTVKLAAGSQSIVFEGLPLGLQADSLHGKVAKGGARIVGVELESGSGEVEETERIEEIRDEMRDIADQLGAVRDRIESLLAQREYLRSTLLANRPEGTPQPELGQVKGTLEYVGSAERDIARSLREQEDKAKELDEKLQPLLIKLENPVATGRTVVVELDVDKAGSIDVDLRYQVFGASWSPSYNARLSQDSGQVELEYFGVVTQRTGEDWDAATIALSTANPSASGSMPELTPWYLGRGNYYGVADNLAAGRGHVEQATSSNGWTPGTEGVLSSSMSAAVKGSGAVVFGIEGKRTIAGDGSPQRLPVGTQTFASTLELATVPKLAPEVFRRARIKYDGAVPLLPGAVSTYVGADFVGSGHTNAVVPGETLLLSFGADDRLKVQRQLLKRQQDYVGAGKKTTRFTIHLRITVSNFSGKAQKVELLDQLPIAEIDKVKVKILEVTPSDPPGDRDPPGLLRWTLDVPDGQRQSVDIQFSVTAPAETAPVYFDELQMMH